MSDEPAFSPRPDVNPYMQMVGAGPAPPPVILFVSRWRRALAFVLDAMILGAGLGVLCIPFFEPLTRVGAWGKLIGFSVFMLYFALMESHLGGGQSQGKRLLRIRVIRSTGTMLSVNSACLRTSVFAVPFFLNGLQISHVRTPAWLLTLLSILIFAVGGTTAYLMLFNGQRRQGLQDLAADSFVIPWIEEGPVERTAIARVHWYVVGIGLALLVLLAVFVVPRLLAKPAFSAMTADIRTVEGFEGVQTASALDLHAYNSSGPAQHILVVTVRWQGAEDAEEAAANAFAQAILRTDAQASHFDSIRILMVRGYDLGLTSSYRSHTFEHAPDQW